jgi:biopolymer transport protein ExbD
MIDVLLVLIIIFMVITPLAPRGLPAAIPQPASDIQRNAAPSSDIVVTVRDDGSTMLNHDVVSLEALRTKLVELYESGRARVIFVRGVGAVEFGRVAEIIDLARGVGVYHVGLMAN